MLCAYLIKKVHYADELEDVLVYKNAKSKKEERERERVLPSFFGRVYNSMFKSSNDIRIYVNPGYTQDYIPLNSHTRKQRQRLITPDIPATGP